VSWTASLERQSHIRRGCRDRAPTARGLYLTESAPDTEQRQEVETLLKAHATPATSCNPPPPISAKCCTLKPTSVHETDPERRRTSLSISSALRGTGVPGPARAIRNCPGRRPRRHGSRAQGLRRETASDGGGEGDGLQLAASVTARKRFECEARAAAAVTHDNVIDIHAVETSDRCPTW
jgi:hypothetical protein